MHPKPDSAEGVPITVGVIDDDTPVRKALTRLLTATGFEVTSYPSATDYLNADHGRPPACLLLDIEMPGLSGLDLQDELAQRHLEPAIVFITGHGTVPRSVQAMKKGAVDFLQKPFDEEDLLSAVRQAVEKGVQSQQDQAEALVIDERLALLTPREKQVMELVVSGLLNKQIASRLGTSEKTIKVHRGRVMRKMRAESLPDLVRMSEHSDRATDAR